MIEPFSLNNGKVEPFEHSAAAYERKIRNDSTQALTQLEKALKAEFEQKDGRAKNMAAWGIFALVAIVMGLYSWATKGGF